MKTSQPVNWLQYSINIQRNISLLHLDYRVIGLFEVVLWTEAGSFQNWKGTQKLMHW